MPTTKPVVITEISGAGPLMALDLATVPYETLLPIVQAALRLANEWSNGNIDDPEYLGAHEDFESLAKASDALSELLAPIIPGGHQATREDLMWVDAYPIIRDGQVLRVKEDELTPLERIAVQRWLSFHASVAATHAERVRMRSQEIASASPAIKPQVTKESASGYEEAPVSDWRL